MELITTHLNADFDGLAAMIAAGVLYPDARLALPGTPSAGVRRWLSLHKDLISVIYPGEIDLGAVTRLVIVDTARRARLGQLADLCDTVPDIHIYDHHPGDSDIEAAVSIIEPVGAAATLLAERLAGQDVDLPPVTATAIALGIYSDTGSLLFPTTSPRDVRAVAWLLERGASVRVIADYLDRDLSPDQRELLTALAADLDVREISGRTAGVAVVSRDDYLGGLSTLARRLLDTGGLDALFVAARMGQRTHLVGRTRDLDLDIGEVLSPWGGRGHPSAASATTTGDPSELREQLFERIAVEMRPRSTAADIMSSPVVTGRTAWTIDHAAAVLERYGHSGLPLVDDQDRLVGVISRRDIDKARRHGLGHVPVTGFASRQVITVSPDTPVDHVRELMVSADKGRLPVVDGDRVIGIVTRTDILRELYGEHPGLDSGVPLAIRQRNVTGRLHRLPADVRSALAAAGDTGNARGESVFLVGGIVRDLLLGVSNWDIDLVVEGDGVEFAGEFARRVAGVRRRHSRFGTATVIIGSGLHVDIATARREYYQQAAALPTVEPGVLKDDLARRDFTVNAMAVSLVPPDRGELVDPFGGRRDLVALSLRVLHNLSFVEDPTRLFRLVRFESRRGLVAEPETERLARDAVKDGMADRLSPERYTAELLLVLDEPMPGAAIRRLADLGLLPGLDTAAADDLSFRVSTALTAAVPFRHQPPLDERVVWLGAIWHWLDREQAAEFSRRLRLERRIREGMEEIERLDTLLETLERDSLPPSAVDAALRDVPAAATALAYARGSDRVRSRLSSFWAGLEPEPIVVSGHDLLAHGYPPGPLFRETLSALRRAVLDGQAVGPDGQLAWALDYIDRRARTHHPVD